MANRAVDSLSTKLKTINKMKLGWICLKVAWKGSHGSEYNSGWF